MTPTLYPLADGYLDGGIEEHAWVPVTLAATAEQALDVITASDWSEAVEQLADDGLRLVATGSRSWHRIAGCAECDGSGAAPSSCYGPAEPCGSCNGTGAQAEDGDGIAWESCDPSAAGAVEFWNLEAVEVER